MRNVILLLSLVVFMAPTKSHASDDGLFIKELKKGTNQGVELLSNEEYQKRIPAALRSALQLP